jgi:hypothetical protein
MNRTRIARKTAAFLVALTAACFILPATAAAEGRPSVATIIVHVDFAGGSAWSSTGAFADGGTVAPLGQRLTGQPPRWVAHEAIHFVGQDGSFTIRQQAIGIDPSPILSVGTSRWVVDSGTGGYDGMRGRGTGIIIFRWDAGTLDVLLTGEVRLPAG